MTPVSLRALFAPAAIGVSIIVGMKAMILAGHTRATVDLHEHRDRRCVGRLEHIEVLTNFAAHASPAITSGNTSRIAVPLPHLRILTNVPDTAMFRINQPESAAASRTK